MKRYFKNQHFNFNHYYVMEPGKKYLRLFIDNQVHNEATGYKCKDIKEGKHSWQFVEISYDDLLLDQI